MVIKIAALIFILFFNLFSFAQELETKSDFDISVSSLVSGDKGQPFWLQTNRLGKVNTESATIGIFDASYLGSGYLGDAGNLNWVAGAELVGSLDDDRSLGFYQYWGQLSFRNFYLHAGAKAESEFNHGLSVSNGNLLLSNNARPSPRVEIGLRSFSPFSGDFGKHFSFDGLYAEHILLDDRIIEHPNLHHKQLGINYQFSNAWTARIVIDDWAYWGGSFSDGRDIPGFEYYFRYIFALKGGEKSQSTEQDNVSGNHLGQYQFSLNHQGESANLDFYWHHLWEDGSGLRFQNVKDGLWGFSYEGKQKKLIDGLVIEYMNTMDQSGRFHKFQPDPNRPDHLVGSGRDNYFSHHIYQSGYTSYSRVVGLPLIRPILNEEGVSKGISNNRLWAFHSGVHGWINDAFSWKLMLAYSKNYGTYGKPVAGSKELLSAGFSLNWQRSQKPFSYHLGVAMDSGNYIEEKQGVEFRIAYHFGVN